MHFTGSRKCEKVLKLRQQSTLEFPLGLVTLCRTMTNLPDLNFAIFIAWSVASCVLVWEVQMSHSISRAENLNSIRDIFDHVHWKHIWVRPWNLNKHKSEKQNWFQAFLSSPVQVTVIHMFLGSVLTSTKLNNNMWRKMSNKIFHFPRQTCACPLRVACASSNVCSWN